jgi:RNA polymerase sigma factor (sigma-70 family)
MHSDTLIVDLVARHGRGDPAATEQLARRACQLALRTSGAILHSREEAGDVAQDVAVEVLRSLPRLRDAAAFDAWVHRITVRQAVAHLKRAGRRGGTETPLVLLPELDEPGGDGGLDREELIAARGLLAAALAALPPRQRLALALRYVHDMSDAEIATALGCRTGTVHALLSRGRAGLRRDPHLAQLAPGGSR